MIPNEIINYIFTFIQGPTNEIMKQFIHNVNYITCKISCKTSCKTNVCHMCDMLYILQMNKQYGFIQYNNIRFNKAYYYKCLNCNEYLTTDEYRYGIYCKYCKILNIIYRIYE